MVVRTSGIVQSTSKAERLALVYGPNPRQGFRRAVEQEFTTGNLFGEFHTGRANPAGTFGGLLKRSRWATVDIDNRAPRLRQVKLPRTLVEADAIAAATDLRGATSARPIIVLGLWAELASPVHRIGAILTGPREGLTAEIGLAVGPAALLVVDRLAAPGQLVAVATGDPIACELVSLAFWQLRQRNAGDLPGPWEDPLIQRATELGLGATQPSELRVSAAYAPSFSDAMLTSARVVFDKVLLKLNLEH